MHDHPMYRVENCLLGQVSLSLLVLDSVMMKLKRLRHPICQVQSGNVYSFKEGKVMEDYWSQTHDFSIVNMITILNFNKLEFNS